MPRYLTQRSQLQTTGKVSQTVQGNRLGKGLSTLPKAAASLIDVEGLAERKHPRRVSYDCHVLGFFSNGGGGWPCGLKTEGEGREGAGLLATLR